MQRIIELCVKIPEIVLTHWFPDEQDALSFPLDKIKGTITLNLDPESVKVLDYEIDYDGKYPVSYGCDSVLVRIEGWMSEGKTEREFLNEICRLAVEYVNRLLSFFRNEMGQYWINLLHIHEHGLSWFLRESDARWVDESGTTRVTIGGITVPPDLEQADLFRYRYRRWRESEIDEREWQKIRDFIERGESSDVAKRLLVNAEQHFTDGDLRMATVEAITALEMKLPSFAQKRLEKRGIEYSKYGNLYAYDYIALLLPLILQEGELDDWMMHQGHSRHPELFIHVHDSRKSADEVILDACKKLNAVRNKIVHGEERGKGKKKVKKYYELACEEVEQGIEAIRGLLDFIEYAKGDF